MDPHHWEKQTYLVLFAHVDLEMEEELALVVCLKIAVAAAHHVGRVIILTAI
jgi:hypothetical protein